MVDQHEEILDQHSTTGMAAEPTASRLGITQELQNHAFLRTPEMRETLQNFSLELGRDKRKRVLLDFAVLCSASFFGVLGCLPLHALQTTINCPASTGYYTLSALYGAFAVAILCASFIMKLSQLSPRVLLLAALTSQVIFISANNYPSIETLLPAAVLSGLGHGILWHVQITLVSSLALRYSSLSSNMYPETMFRTIFVLIYELGFIIGNLYTSALFYSTTSASMDSISYSTGNSFNETGSNSTNLTLCNNWQSDIFTCDPLNDLPGDNKLLFSTYSIFIVTGFLVVLLGLHSPDVILLRSSPSTESVCSTLQNIWGSCRVTIVLFCCFTGVQQAFVFGDIAMLVGSTLGLHMVGIGMAYYGICRLPWMLMANSRKTGCKKIGMLGLVCYILSMIAYMFTGAFFSVKAVTLLQWLMPIWGFMDGLNEQLIAGWFYNANTRSATGMMYPFFHSIGMCIGLALAPYICPMIRIQAQLTLLTFTLLFGLVIAPCIRNRRKDTGTATDRVDNV